MQSVLGKMRRAILEYKMIENGDKIAVGLSGGKDSMMLLEGLFRLKKFIGIDFDLMAITVDPCFNGKNGDFSKIEEFCAERNIPYVINRSDLGEIIFDIRKEKNPCSLCARMRRGIIHDITKEHGFNKLALGHHKDDAVETFVMNLFQEGRLGCFQPVTYLSIKDLTMIRPLLYVTEKEVVKVVKKEEFPIVKSSCPVDGSTTREETKNWIKSMEQSTVPNLSEKIFGAMTRSELKGWKIKSDDSEL